MSPIEMENYRIAKYSPESQEGQAMSPDSLEVHVPCGDNDDDGPFFDLDLTVPLCFDGKDSSPCTDEDCEEEEFEFNFSISSSNQSSPSQSISLADNLFYQGQLLPLHENLDMASKLVLGDGEGSLQSCNGNVIKTHFPTLLKTATKLKISLFGLKKTARVGMDLQGEFGSGMESPVQKQNKFFTVKFKVVDVPLVSLFTRDNSRGPKRDESSNALQKKSEDSDGDVGQGKSNDREKKKAKEIVQKYVKKIKPLYVKISQKYNEKARHPDPEKSGAVNVAKSGRVSSSEKSQNQLSFSGNLKMVYKHFGKVRNSQASSVNRVLPTQYSESTMLELQNAIQGAIAHCKQSNYADDTPNSPDSDSSDSSH